MNHTKRQQKPNWKPKTRRKTSTFPQNTNILRKSLLHLQLATLLLGTWIQTVQTICQKPSKELSGKTLSFSFSKMLKR
jgi:hypothetical protein